MSVPVEIRNVPRPVNTIVKAYGKNKDKYIVIARKPSIRRSDGKYRPVNSGTIGHIENGKFVPIAAKPLQNVSMETTNDVYLDKF